MNPYRIIELGRGGADHLVRSHYLHKWPAVVVLTLGLLDGSRVIGCVVFAMPPRETLKRYGVKCAWELARLFIEDCTPKNAETWFVARAVAWIRRNRPDVDLLVSYADPAVGHAGTIYKAGNWIADGRTDSERKTPRFDHEDAEPERTLFGFGKAKKYTRRSRIPQGTVSVRLPRVSKWRFIYWLDGKHEQRRKHALELTEEDAG